MEKDPNMGPVQGERIEVRAQQPPRPSGTLTHGATTCCPVQPQLSSSVRASNTLFICCTPLGTSFSCAHADDEGPVLPVNTPAEQGAANQDIRSGNPSHRGFEEENSTIPELEEALAIPSGNPFSVLTQLGSDTLMNC